MVVPLAELYVILKVGDAIGYGWTILLLAADSLLGALLLRSQGRAVWRALQRDPAEGRMPHREVMDGVLVIFGGAFLITPGFITDILGVLLLLPPTRAWSAAASWRAGSAAAWRSAVACAAAGAARLRRRGHRARVRRLRPAQARAVSAPALALSFFDAAHDIHGTARSGMSDPVRGPQAHGPPGGPGDRGRRPAAGGRCWRTRLSLEFEPVSPAADLGGVRAHVARVRGEAAGRRVDGLGTVVGDRRAAAVGGARRGPRHLGAGGRAARARGARPASARRGRARRRGGGRPGCSRTTRCSRWRTRASRPSTTAAAASAAPGSSCGCPGEDYPRRGSGQVIAGSSLDLDALQVHVAVFRWRLDGREGIGSYELMLRMEPPAAA